MAEKINKYVFSRSPRAEGLRNGGLRQLHRENQKKVIDLNTGQTYDSVKDAALATGFSRGIIHKVVHEHEGYSEYKGFKFRFV